MIAGAGWSFGDNSFDVIRYHLNLNFVSLFCDNAVLRQLSNKSLGTDLLDLKTIMSKQNDPDLDRICGKVEDIATHCMGVMPIESAYRGKNNTHESKRKDVVPCTRLPPPIKRAHKHLHCKKGSSKTWFQLSSQGKHTGLDAMRHGIEHNGNAREPYIQYTVCIVKVERYQDTRTVIITGCEGFRCSPHDLPIERVYVFQCGPAGIFSEDGGSVSLIRDNFDMFTPITNKKWMVKDMIASVTTAV